MHSADPSTAKHRRLWLLLMAGAVAAMLAVPAIAGAHLERPSYWPDPAPDNSVTPPAGGKVPKARSLASAVTGAGPGEVRVVCQGKNGARSLRLVRTSIRKAQKRGFRLRPSQPLRKISAKRARVLRRINRALARKCKFHAVQPASTRRATTTAWSSCPAATPSPPPGARRSTTPAATRACCRKTRAARRRRATSTRQAARTTRT